MRILATIWLILFSLFAYGQEQPSAQLNIVTVTEHRVVNLVQAKVSTEVYKGTNKESGLIIGGLIGAGLFGAFGYYMGGNLISILLGLLFGTGLGAALAVSENEFTRTKYHELYLQDVKTGEEIRIRMDNYPLAANETTNLHLRKYSDGSYTLRKAEK